MRVRRNICGAVIVGVILVGRAAAVGAGGSASPPQAPTVGPLNGPQNPATPAYQVEWIANTVPTLMEAGRDHTASLTIRNSGTEPWSAGTLFATYRWDATPTANAGQFASLSLPTVLSLAVPPGQEVTLDRVRIRPPATPGPYTLTFSLDDGRRSFEKSGTAALSVGVTVAPQGGALTDAGYKVAWTAIDIPKTMASGFDHFGRIALRNISPELWPAGTVLASYHWYGSGTMLPDLAPQTRMPFPIPPGQEAQVDNLLILPPRQPGNYELQVTLVDQTAWFETKGAATVTVPVTVTPGRASAGPFITEEAARPMSLVLSRRSLRRLLGIHPPPLIPVIGLAYTWRHRKEPTARYALLLTALTIGVHTFYYTQEARFAAAPATLLGIYGAVAGARAFRRGSAIAAEVEAALAAPVVYQPFTPGNERI